MTSDMSNDVRDMPKNVAEIQIEEVRRVPLRVPRCSPILLSFVRNEALQINDFFRHYRDLGIRHFVMTDNGSDDGTFEFLNSQPDVDLYRYAGDYSAKIRNIVIQKCIERYGMGRWYVFVDGDEQIVFERAGEKSLEDLVHEMEARDISRVRGLLVDMYSSHLIGACGYQPGDTLKECHPFFDKDYREYNGNRLVWVKGGPRVRVFGSSDPLFDPILTKYPLFRAEDGDVIESPHYMWPYEKNFASARFLGILHFKFLPDFPSKLHRAVTEMRYWNKSFDYKIYADRLAREPDLSFMSPSTGRYTSPADLVAAGVIDAVGWTLSE